MPGTVPSWADLYRRLPPGLEPYALELEWDREHLWSLDLPVEEMEIAELEWQLALPSWRAEDRYFCVRPLDLLEAPHRHLEQLERTLRSDLAFPLDITLRSGRWFVLDGVHRLLKAVLAGERTVSVRKVPIDLLAPRPAD